MHRIRLIHWKPPEAEQYAVKLKKAGFRNALESISNEVIKADRRDPPDLILIDLNRLPSQGRDMGIGYRIYRDTRNSPIIFIGGDQKKVAAIREILPDAYYTTWTNIDETIKRAISTSNPDPIVPHSRMQGYAGTPLPKKLGIKMDSVVALVGAPDGFQRTLGALPPGVRIRNHARGKSDLTLWFVTRKSNLMKRIERLGTRAENGGLRILWPKKASGMPSDLTQNIIRQAGLNTGLVDFKIASIDDNWSGLRFTLRKVK